MSHSYMLVRHSVTSKWLRKGMSITVTQQVAAPSSMTGKVPRLVARQQQRPAASFFHTSSLSQFTSWKVYEC